MESAERIIPGFTVAYACRRQGPGPCRRDRPVSGACQSRQFGGDVDCSAATLVQPGGHALRLDRATINGAFFLRQGASVTGALDLTATLIGAIDDGLNEQSYIVPGLGDAGDRIFGTK